MDQLAVRPGEPLADLHRSERLAIEGDRGRTIAHHKSRRNGVKVLGNRGHGPFVIV